MKFIRNNLGSWTKIAVFIYLVLLAVAFISSGFKVAAGGADAARSILEFTSSPLLGLLAGMIATALVQSSSTVTSIVVGLVGAGLPIPIAIPMIMGANIGTTLTNTLVSIGHVRDREEFKRAFSAATVHDFFNFLAVLIFLPLELMFGLLEKLSLALVDVIGFSVAVGPSGGPIKAITKPVVKLVSSGLSDIPHQYAGSLMIASGIILVLLSITGLGRVLKGKFAQRLHQKFEDSLGMHPILSIFTGMGVTVLVQSSSTTTSLLVPFAGNGIMNTKEVYPFTLGANVGTCVTALVAALAISGPFANLALQIAFVHLLFNVLAVTLIYSVPFLRNIPVYMAEWMAAWVLKTRLAAFGYITAVFFVAPGVIVYLARTYSL